MGCKNNCVLREIVTNLRCGFICRLHHLEIEGDLGTAFHIRQDQDRAVAANRHVLGRAVEKHHTAGKLQLVQRVTVGRIEGQCQRADLGCAVLPDHPLVVEADLFVVLNQGLERVIKQKHRCVAKDEIARDKRISLGGHDAAKRTQIKLKVLFAKLQREIRLHVAIGIDVDRDFVVVFLKAHLARGSREASSADECGRKGGEVNLVTIPIDAREIVDPVARIIIRRGVIERETIGILPFPAGQDIEIGATVDRVIPVTTVDDIFAKTTEQKVIAFATKGDVTPVTAIDGIIAISGKDDIGAAIAFDHIVETARRSLGIFDAQLKRIFKAFGKVRVFLGKVRHERAKHELKRRHVKAKQIPDRFKGGLQIIIDDHIAHNEIDTVTAADRVGTRAADDEVISALAFDQVVALFAEDGVKAISPHDLIVTAGRHAAVAEKHVIAIAAVDRIATAQADHHIASVGAFKIVAKDRQTDNGRLEVQIGIRFVCGLPEWIGRPDQERIRLPIGNRQALVIKGQRNEFAQTIGLRAKFLGHDLELEAIVDFFLNRPFNI